jgi:tetratricopeptide (TPR) repeat protein
VRLRRRDTLLLVGIAVALVTAMGLQIARDRQYPRDQQLSTGILYVRSGAVLKRLTLEYDGLAADVYWIRAIQYYGGNRLKTPVPGQRRYELLYPLLDIATALDPYFSIAYRFGAIFLSEGYPGGPARPDQSVALLRKALAAMPDKWQYAHDIAFVYYWHLRDYTAAATWFQRAAAQPNAPNWLAPMAATMLTHSEDRASARFLWQRILESEEAWLRRAAERALLQLQALDQIDQLEAGIKRYPVPAGERYSWDAYIRKGMLRGVPLDPAGTPYELDPVTGRVTASKESKLFPLPDDTRRQP